MDNTMDYGADILTLVDDDGVEHQFEVADTMDYEDPISIWLWFRYSMNLKSSSRTAANCWSWRW